MTPSDFASLRAAVTADEGFQPLVYDDATGQVIKAGDTLQGNPSLGYGMNVASTPLPRDLAGKWLDDVLAVRVSELTRGFPVVLTLDGPRQIVLGNMAYNLGVPRLSDFRKMWAAIHAGDFDAAAAEILDSTAARTLPARYARFSHTMKTGVLL